MLNPKKGMKILKGKQWMSPFATQVSCINTIYGECPRGLTLDECMHRCEENPACNIGYFVEDQRPNSDIQSYCVPLTNHDWGNTNVFDVLFSSENPTNLSTKNGIDYTLFYNENKFMPPEDFPHDYDNFLFSMNNVYLCWNDDPHSYMKDDFTFTPYKDEAYVIKILKVDRSFVNYAIRMTYGMELTIYQYNLLINLKINNDKKFIWEAKEPLQTTFRILKTNNKKSEKFLNNRNKFHLQYKHFFLIVNKEGKLALSKKKPKHAFSFHKIKYKGNVNADRKIYQRTNDFFCRNFPQCKNPIDTPSRAWKWSVIILVLFFLLLFSITMLIWIASRRV